jgi:hypothetical protein
MMAGSPISLQLLDWFAGPEIRVAPSREDVHRQIARLDILGPLRARAELFVGREPELRALGSYVFARGSESRPLLMICGLGGTGKSALVARFVTNRLNELELIYVDVSILTSQSTGPARLERIWAEIYRQLCLLRPALRSVEAEDGPVEPERLRLWLSKMSDSTRPLLLVLDGVEELQFGDGFEAERLYTVLGDLQEAAPNLRIVLVSRRRPTRLDLEILELKGLSAEDADGLLSLLSIESVEARRKILAVAGPLPFTLKLAADVVRQSGAESIDSIGKISLEYLVSRILERIASPESGSTQGLWPFAGSLPRS